MHNRKNTRGSDRCRAAASAEQDWNRNEDPPNRRGRSIRRAAERKARVKKAARLAEADVERATEVSE